GGITLLPFAETLFDFSSITRAILTGDPLTFFGIVLTAERCCEPGVSLFLILLLKFVLFSGSPLSPPSRYPFPLKGIRSCLSCVCVLPAK
ncbi:hypothetical protein N332_14234, partial [Mesitornis unicolor]